MTDHAIRLLPVELEHWRDRHGISDRAWKDLQMLLAPPIQPFALPESEYSEAHNQAHVRLVASSREHVLLSRNNVGAFTEPGSKRQVRYGLCNDSKKLNEKWKSSDLIGGTPIVITPHHVGMRVLIYTAIEMKASNWKPGKASVRERAQLRYGNAVRSAGGFFFFCNDPQQYVQFLDAYGVPLIRR